MKKVIYSFLMFCTISCSNSLEQDLTGSWEINNTYWNNKKFDSELLSNSLSFSRNYQCGLPIQDINERKTGGDSGRWKLMNINENNFLEIESNNLFFNRKFIIERFNKQKDIQTGYKFIEMTLISDSLKIELIRKWDVK
jgi:hypothetical protein